MSGASSWLASSIVLVSLLLAVSLLTNRASAERFAVVIGNNHGSDEEELLRWAERDAERALALLTDLAEVREEHAVVLLGKRGADVRAALARVQQQIAALPRGEPSTLFVYYSGHGDAAHLHLGDTLLPQSELERWIDATHARTVVTSVDACRDEPMRRKGARHAPPFDIKLAHANGPRGRVTITSSARDELAQESDSLRSSFFTHHLLSGMRGAADRDGDRQVSLDELYRYAYHHTLASSHAHLAAVQHPQLEVDLQGEGDLMITRIARADASLTLTAASTGDYLIVERESGQVLAQLDKTAGNEVHIALPAGRFLVQKRAAGALYTGTLALEWGGNVKLDDTTLEQTAARATLAKGLHARPVTWIASLAARLGRAPASRDSLALGAGAESELVVTNYRLFLAAALGVASGESSLQERTYYQSSLMLGAARRFSLQPVDIVLGVGVGVLWIREHSLRTADDGSAALDVAKTARFDAVGPYAGPRVAMQLPLRHDFLALVQAELPIALVRLDDSLTWKLTPALSVGAGRRF
jgi:hypothetical protein